MRDASCGAFWYPRGKRILTRVFACFEGSHRRGPLDSGLRCAPARFGTAGPLRVRVRSQFKDYKRHKAERVRSQCKDYKRAHPITAACEPAAASSAVCRL
jgi:hypothetical protein